MDSLLAPTVGTCHLYEGKPQGTHEFHWANSITFPYHILIRTNGKWYWSSLDKFLYIDLSNLVKSPRNLLLKFRGQIPQVS